jgi:DNA-binding NtrC family response regulator
MGEESRGGSSFADATTERSELGPSSVRVVRRFRLAQLEGPSVGAVFRSTSDRCAIGSHPSNELVIEHPTVSRFHCEIVLDRRGARVRDLGSLNGTSIDGVEAVEAFLRDGSLLRIGDAVLRFESEGSEVRLPLADREAFGGLIGRSPAMRASFALLERAAESDATVLLQGETGTGKEVAAEALHENGPRAKGPLVVVDCGSIPPALLESELFGHEKGAFTGAHARRTGAFEAAHGGTLFLDEVGELPTELQPKLLRVLEQRAVRRVGGSGYRAVDVRVIAATNRDLRGEVNRGGFRADLYFRLAVVTIRLPPLRERLEDLELLVAHLLDRLQATAAQRRALARPEAVATMRGAAWPGNVRELHNYLVRCMLGGEAPPLAGAAHDAAAAGPDPRAPWEEARRQAIARFEREYVQELLARNGGKVAQAAREANMDRVYLYRLIWKHGLEADRSRGPGDPERK